MRLFPLPPDRSQVLTFTSDVLTEAIEWTGAVRARLCEKTAFWGHLYIKCIILPRQARDKHRENSKKSTGFLQHPYNGTRDEYLVLLNAGTKKNGPLKAIYV